MKTWTDRKRIAPEMKKDKCLSCGAINDLCFDHIKPKKLGGSDDRSNLQVLCRPCNTIKRQETIDFSKGVPEWFSYRRTLRCQSCKSMLGYVRIDTQERVCRSCGAIKPLKQAKKPLETLARVPAKRCNHGIPMDAECKECNSYPAHPINPTEVA